jgi:hypothetical protein
MSPRQRQYAGQNGVGCVSQDEISRRWEEK